METDCWVDVGINIVIVIKICRNQGYKEWRSKLVRNLHFPVVIDRADPTLCVVCPTQASPPQRLGDPKPSIKDLHNRLYQLPVFAPDDIQL